MQIITDLQESRLFVKNLAGSLNDLSYWNNWIALHITSQEGIDWIKQAKITALIRSMADTDLDGTALWLDKSMLLVCPQGTAFDIPTFIDSLMKINGLTDIKTKIFSVTEDTEKLLFVLQRLQQGPTEKSALPPANYAFLKSIVPNVDNLLREWHQEKTKRAERTKPHIMIVDDDPMALRLVTKALEKDYVVIAARNGAEAITKHLQQMPDIIFLDIGLPDCDGLTLLNYMQQYDNDCRVVMFSADSFLKTRVQAFADGAKGFLPKPFTREGFQKQIAKWFADRTGT